MGVSRNQSRVVELTRTQWYRHTAHRLLSLSLFLAQSDEFGAGAAQVCNSCVDKIVDQSLVEIRDSDHALIEPESFFEAYSTDEMEESVRVSLSTREWVVVWSLLNTMEEVADGDDATRSSIKAQAGLGESKIESALRELETSAEEAYHEFCEYVVENAEGTPLVS